MLRSYASAERKYWPQTKRRGKNRFIWREVLGGLLIWLIVIPVVEMLGERPHSFSVASTVLIGLITLPISLLGGYLAGIWRWKDREKKYPEDSLPPWE
jgi:membrane protein DedA with SNARE-associated domain